MTRKNLKKTTEIIKKQLLPRKIASSTLSTNSHYFKRIAFVAIIILSVTVLSIVTEDFGLDKSFVQGNTVQGIGVGIYWNQDCTNRTLTLSWGATEVGSSSNLTVYIRNEGNSKVSLRLRQNGFHPPHKVTCH